MVSKRWAQLVKPPRAKPPSYTWPAVFPDLVWVQKAEEKGSDVNLASHLVRDAFMNLFDVAVVVTNDTDLIEPIKIVRDDVGKAIGLLSDSIQETQMERCSPHFGGCCFVDPIHSQCPPAGGSVSAHNCRDHNSTACPLDIVVPFSGGAPWTQTGSGD